jgi:regulator of sigma E protease
LFNIIISIVAILVTIVVIIGFHEFGHFIVARLLGIKVLRFSIGFGKKLYAWHDKKGTEYVLAAIPLGGYVKMLDETEGPVAPHEMPLTFNRQPFYKKSLIVIAGPLFNFILAIFLYWLLFMIGFTTIAPLIGSTAPHSIAAAAGIKPQEEIISINGRSTRNWTSVMIQLLENVGDKKQLSMTTQVRSTGKLKNISLDLTHWHLDHLRPDPLSSLGIVPYVPDTKWPPDLLRKIQYPPLLALYHASQDVSDFIRLNLMMLKKMLTGQISFQSLGGPITIFQGAGTSLNSGILPFLSFIAFISIAIGVINIIPIPGLDGGHLLIYIIELIIRRPLSVPAQELMFRIGFILLVLLAVQAITNDVMRIGL